MDEEQHETPIRVSEAEERKFNRRKALQGAAVLGAAVTFGPLLASCGSSPSASTSSSSSSGGPVEKMKVALVDYGQSSGSAWCAADWASMQYAMKELPWLNVTHVENVPETSACIPLLRQLAQAGNKIVFVNDFGFGPYIEPAARDYPDTVFLCGQGVPEAAPNVGSYYGYHDQARYLTGIVAGLTTKTNTIGYVGAFAIPPVTAGLDAFALGVKSVNPTAEVMVLWISTWYDPAKEKDATDALINAGCDVVGSHTDSDAVLKAAAARGKLAIGSTWSWAESAPKAFLTAPVFDWGPYYVKTCTEVKDGTWKPGRYMGSVADGMFTLAPYGPAVSETTKAVVAKAKEDIVSGKVTLFTGPLTDNTGKLQVKAGEVYSEEDALNNMNWLLDNIKGTIKQ